MPLFIRRPQQAQIVEAEQVGPGAQAHPQGTRSARPGDWIVTDHGTGQQSVLTSDEFSAQYEAAPIPSHLAPRPAAEPPDEDQGDQGQATESAFPGRQPVDFPSSQDPNVGTGDVSPSSQPMTDQLPGRQTTSGEFRPRVESGEPVLSPTGLPQQPGDADKAFHERQPSEPDTGDEDNPEEAPPPEPTAPAPNRARRGQSPAV